MSKGIKRLFWDVEYVWRIEPHYTCILWGGHLVIISDSHRQKGGILAMQMTADGYPRYKINNAYRAAHRIVADKFLGEQPDGLITNHIDGNKLNNDPSNLEYVTPRENIHHAIENGLHVASDPTRMPTYKDGRCMNDRKGYKRRWYMENRAKLLRREQIRYAFNKEKIT